MSKESSQVPQGLKSILLAAGMTVMHLETGQTIALSDINGPPLHGNVPPIPHVGAPGETIAEGAAHALGHQFSPGAGGGFGHNAHVKTPGGVKLFHEPIGALIVAHPHPQHMAEHGVNSGTHKYVQVAEHTYAVHKDADVHVPKDTDVHDEGAVKAAPKVVVGKSESGKKVHATLTPRAEQKLPSLYEHTPEAAHALEQNWKKLPAGAAKKPVSLHGAHAGWVPHDWKVYKAKGHHEESAGVKWAQSPDGGWHVIGNVGTTEVTGATKDKLAEMAKSGELEESDAPHPKLGAVPHMPKEGAEPAKVNVGGVNVTHGEIKSAIAHLNEAKSTNVKTPLKVKGHPLADMDYMAVSKAELKAHPHLKVPPGTKTQHVGQVKLAVLHHLHAKAAELAKNEAEHHAAAQGVKAAEDTAAHAQKLTPSIAEFPTEAAAEAPHAEGGTKTLEWYGQTAEIPAESKVYRYVKGNGKYEFNYFVHQPDGAWWSLSASGYHKDPAPKTLDEWLAGGKLKEFPNAAKATKAAAADLGPGGSSVPIPGDEPSYKPTALVEPEEPVEEAPKAAPVGVLKSKAEPVSWGGVQVTTDQLHQAAEWLEETKSSQAGFKAGMNKLGNPMAQADYMGVAKAWKTANPAAAKGLNTKQLMAAHVNELLATMDKADEESGHNEAAALHEAIEQPPPEDWVEAISPAPAAAKALHDAAETGQTQYVAAQPDGTFDTTVTPDQAIVYTADKFNNLNVVLKSDPETHVPEETVPVAVKDVLEAVTKAHEGSTTATALVGESEVDHGVEVYSLYDNHQQIEDILNKVPALTVAQAAVGVTPYDSPKAVSGALWAAHNGGNDKFLWMTGDGKWELKNYATAGAYAAPGQDFYHVTANHVVIHHYADGSTFTLPGKIVQGFLEHTYPQAKAGPEPEAPGGTIPIWANGAKVGEAPAGSKVYHGAKAANPATAAKLVKFPDGSWHHYSNYEHNGGPKHTVLDDYVAEESEGYVQSGQLKELDAHAAEGQQSVEQNGHVYHIKPGTTMWKDKAYPDLGVFIRQSDGKFLWWPATAAQPDDFGDSDATMKQGILDGSLVPYGPTAEVYAKTLGAAKNDQEVIPAPAEDPQPEPTAPPVPKDQKVTVEGAEVSVPASSKVYWFGSDMGEHSAAMKYVKNADGSWDTASQFSSLTAAPVSYDSYVTSGQFLLSGTPYQPPAPAPEVEKAVEEAPDLEIVEDLEETAAEGAPIPALYYSSGYSGTGGYQVKGEFPAGSQLYTYATTPDGKGNTYAKTPDGKWLYATSGTPFPTSDQQSKVDDGSLVPTQPPTAALLEHLGTVKAVQEALKTSAVPQPHPTWQHAAAAGLSATIGYTKDVYAFAKPGGGFTFSKWEPHSQSQFWKVSHGTLTGEHSVGGQLSPISFDEVKQLVAENTVPSSVLLVGNTYKHGFYYKSDKAKAYLEVKPTTGVSSNAAGKAAYVWHDTKGGTKTVTPAYAKNFLQDGAAEHYYPAPKPEAAVIPAVKAVKATYVTTGDKPATYAQWDYSKHGTAGIQWQKHADGSVSMIDSNGSPTALEEGDHSKLWDALLGGGSDAAPGLSVLVDQYQNSVVMPGVQPAKLVVLGSEHTPEEIKDILGKLEKLPATGDFIPEDEKWTNVFTAWHGKWLDNTKVAKAFIAAKADGAATGTGHKDAIQGLLRELLQIPQQPSGAVLSGGVEPSFLKGLPPGIHTSKDVFSWTGGGYAKPFGGAGIGVPAYLSTPELADKIKAVSADFGGGKVVGTHVASLNKGEKVAWLDAWKQGNMPAVFALDAKGGKVSPAHPGAPANTGTHAVTWSPWNPAEVPASKTVEGAWTAEGTTLPAAEADNYIIKAGLQHAEYLSQAEKKNWVLAHRSHDQEKVDALSKTASDRWQSGISPSSNVPAWTDDIKPAKTYDAHLDSGNPASYWSSTATLEFASDHEEELAPFTAQWAEANGYPADSNAVNLSYYAREQIIQSYLDAQKAKLEAEQSVPVWAKTPGTVTGGSHEIYELTKTIPLTGAKSQWMFKPAQGGQKFIAEQEHHATQLANAWGFKTPASQLMEFNGTFGQAQARLGAVSDLSYGVSGFYDNPPIPWADFTARQVSDIAREHVLDWALDNNDGRASNFLMMPDGSVVGIDKGAAWKNFGKWDGLAGDSKADVQSRQVSTALYDAIRAHTIAKDVADKAYIATIQRARKMEKLSDDSMRAILEAAFANRTDFGHPGNKEALITAAVTRKNKLAADFGKLWGRVYKDAGWSLPEVPEQKLPLNKQGVQLHSGFSDADFLEHVAATKSAGTHAFFGGTELGHAGFTVWKEFEGHGDAKPVIWGESTAVGPAYDKLVAWATEHQTANHTGYNAAPAAKDVVQGEKAFYDKIIAGAKTVSHHAVDKNYNAGTMSAFNAAVSELESVQLAAESLVGTAGEDKPYKGTTPANVADMAKYYLRLAEKVNDAKDKGGTFAPGDLPRWEAPPDPKKPEEEKKQLGDIKVELTTPYRPAAHVTNIHGYASNLTETHELHVDPSKKAVGESSNVWRVTLPTGEEIEFSNGSQHGVLIAHYGRLRFRSKTGDAASMERIRGALQMMGLNMKEAEEHDLELHYWRHLGLILADRVDGRDPSSKYAKVWSEIKASMTARGLPFKAGADNLAGNVFALEDAGLPPEDEAGIWRNAWATVTSKDQVDKFVGAGAHLPHLRRMDITAPGAHGGVPFWNRFDMDQKFLASRKLPAHKFYAQNKAEAALGVIHGGGLLSAEERMRYLGMWFNSDYGNTADSGGTTSVFMHLNKEGWQDADLYLSPRVLARTSNYAFPGDNYGKVYEKSIKSYFDPAKSTNYAGDKNETMVDAATSLLDDIELLKVKTSAQRETILAYLKELGITEIRGMPVEQRIVLHISAADIKRIHDQYKNNPDMLDPIAELGGPADSPVPLTGDDVIVLDTEKESVFA